MKEIRVPKVNNADDSYTLVEWLAKKGEAIKNGQDVAVLETSKATFDLAAEYSGVIQPLAETGIECAIGSAIALVFDDEAEYKAYNQSAGQASNSGGSRLTITKGAQELMDKYGLARESLAILDKRVIKASDIENLLKQGGSPAAAGIRLSKPQLAVARVVKQSRDEIPSAFLLMKVFCEAAENRMKVIAEQLGNAVDLPDLLVKVVASRLRARPHFFGQLIDDTSLLPAKHANIGVTMDVGRGLFVPVVKQAETMSLREITDVLMEYRVGAMRGEFAQDVLEGGNISISINNDNGVLAMVPIVFPGQICMVSLGCTQPEPFPAPDGGVIWRRGVNLGLSYDHRAINGRDAVVFLGEIKTVIENPDRWSADGIEG